MLLFLNFGKDARDLIVKELLQFFLRFFV
jgi:hypothetical protein